MVDKFKVLFNRDELDTQGGFFTAEPQGTQRQSFFVIYLDAHDEQDEGSKS